MARGPNLLAEHDIVVVTGAAGFIGAAVVRALIRRGLRRIRCLVRPSSDTTRLIGAMEGGGRTLVSAEVLRGNLLSSEDCRRAVSGAAAVIHLAAGRGEKSFPDAFMNSVVSTRNLLDACVENTSLRRFVNVSSFSVYSNQDKPRGRLLDEDCPMEPNPHLRGDAYTFAKVKQDEMVLQYAKRFRLPLVIIRPGVVYGEGNEGITGRVGVATFGLFLHLGGSNAIPLTHVDNCADAIALAATTPGVDGQVFNVVDDDLPTSRQFLRLHKKHVRPMHSIYLPHGASFLLCWLWESYSRWSEGQLPPTFNRRVWHAYWKRTKYTNLKVKEQLKWKPAVTTQQGLRDFFASCKRRTGNG